MQPGEPPAHSRQVLPLWSWHVASVAGVAQVAITVAPGQALMALPPPHAPAAATSSAAAVAATKSRT
jgi:hypothetical protein